MTSAINPPLLAQLIQSLRGLPGMGPRSAERLAYHLLQTKERGLQLAALIDKTLRHMQHCDRCHTFSETSRCLRCQNPARDATLLCITETPYDLSAIEQSGAYRGGYYVLMGQISPLEGIGPEELGLSRLVTRLQEEPVQEVILALSPTVEGQTTQHCIQTLLKPFKALKLTQLAHGVPLGFELASLDGFTITSALQNRCVL